MELAGMRTMFSGRKNEQKTLNICNNFKKGDHIHNVISMYSMILHFSFHYDLNLFYYIPLKFDLN